MKKLTSILLLLCMLLSVCGAMTVSAEESALKNVALGCTYTGTAPYTIDADKYAGKDNYRLIDGKELTDGVKGSTSKYGTTWYALYNKAKFDITLDLGKTTDGIVKIVSEWEKEEGASIYLPPSVIYSGSHDNKTWTELGKAEVIEKSTVLYDYSLTLPKEGSYRYIRLDIEKGTGMFCFVSEVEVFTGTINEIEFARGATSFFKDDQILGTHANVKLADFLATLNTVSGVTVKDSKGKEKTTGFAATGDVLTKKTDKGDKSFTVVIDGDVTSDGKVDAQDYMVVKSHVLKKIELKGASYTAGNCNGDKKIDAMDYMQIKSHVLKKTDLYSKYPPINPEPDPEPEPADGRGDVIAEYKDMDVTDNIKTLTEWEMTFKHTDANTYTMTCKVDGGDLTLTFISRPWGTYNLGAWSYKDAKGTHKFATGSTDMEYVYRVRKNDKSGYVWSGGNHGNEKMLELKFYNEKNEELNLAVGESANIKLLHIVEKTQLYNLPDNYDKLFDHDDQYYYANAVRTYDIVGPQIRLAVDYKYVKDTAYLKSYTCMMPIEKKLGLYCAGIDKDGKLAFVYETTKNGIKPDYSGTTWQGKAAVRCIIFGYGSEAPYRLDVRVLTPDTSTDNNKSKLMFWDMNAGSNKLYFSKYDDSDYSKGQVAKDTEIHMECQWTYFYDKTAEPKS